LEGNARRGGWQGGIGLRWAGVPAGGGAPGPPVAAGLRLQGVWRERLLPFARKYRAMPCIHDALVLVAVRRRDPLVEQAARILAGKRLLSAGELAARRRSRRRR
jgi:hypothetical protein